MSTTFKPVETQDLETLAQLAHEIWFEYWPGIIGLEQTEYMVAKFQTLEAMQRGIAEQGYRYWFIIDESSDGALPHYPIVGYTGGYTEDATNRFFISKIYLLQSARGHGYCSKTIAFYDELCHAENLHAMYLTVNKHNDLGIRAYVAKGFETIDAVESDIGNGFVMDDYIMERSVSLA